MVRSLKLLVAALLVAALTPSAVSAAVRKPTGTLTVAVVGLGAEQWLPNRLTNIALSPVSGMFDFLLYRDPPTRKLQPGLAQSWKVSADGKAWTFNLRKGVQFHDNWGEVTSADVKFTIDLVLRKDSVATRAGILRPAIEAIETPDPYTIVIKTKNPVGWLGYEMSNVPPNIAVVSKKYIESVGEDAAARKPIGSGPLKFVEHRAGDYIKMEALDNHWRVVPAFKTVIVRSVPEEATRVSMLRTGDVDVSDLSLAFKKEAQAAGIEVRRSLGASDVHVEFGNMLLPSKPTYDAKVPWVGPDPQKALKVRQAMVLAVNSKEIIEHILMGEAETMVVPLFAPGSTYLPPELKPYPYDPVKARRLLAEAGYPNGFELTMRLVSNPGTPESVDMAEAVAMAWEKIGLKVKRVTMDYNGHRATMLTRQMANHTYLASLSMTDEPYNGVLAVSHSNSSTLLLAEDATVDRLADLAGATLDNDRRVGLQRQIARIWYDSYYGVPIGFKHALYGVGKRIDKTPFVVKWAYPHNLEYFTAR